MLTLGWPAPTARQNVTWTFVLDEVAPGVTRLLVRVRGGPGYRFHGLPLPLTRLVVRVVHFIMQRKQLLGIASRAESTPGCARDRLRGPSTRTPHGFDHQREGRHDHREGLRHEAPGATYFALTFAVSWAGVLLVVGPGGIPGTVERFMTVGPVMYLAMLAGPSVAGLLMTGLVSGRAGFRELLARLLKWRVGGRWYAVALLTAPLLVMAVSLALSLLSA